MDTILNLNVPVEIKIFLRAYWIERYVNKEEWQNKAKALAAKYIKNFEQYCDNDAKALIPSGPNYDKTENSIKYEKINYSRSQF